MLEPELGSDDGSEALARYLAGEGSPEERAAMSRWLAENPERQTEVRALEKQLQRLAFSAPADLDVDAAWRRTALRLAEMDVRPLSPAHRRFPPIAAIAALLALVALGGFLLWQSVRSRKALARVYTTTTGRRDSITFADGGRIVLAPGSTLAAHHRPGSRPGEVTLEGEAYFEIPHDPARPFVVRTVNAEITDLGTVFTVRSAVEGAVAVQ
jgi:transmembrane sensor